MKYKRQTWLWISFLVIIGVVIVFIGPLFHKGFFVTDDGDWMIIRLSAFFQSLREGQFPVRFLGRLNYSFGYPVANFLYPGFLYIGSLIHLLGFTFVDSVKLILGGSIVIGALCTFLWLRQYFSVFPSLIGSVGFILAPYLSFDLFTRGSVGEILALGWAAMGLFSIAAKKPWLFSLAVSLLIVSHNSLAFLFLGFYVLYLSVEGLWRTFWLMFILGIGMVTFFWFPALHDQKYVVFDTTQVANPNNYFILFKNLSLLGLSGILAAVMSSSAGTFMSKQKNFFLIVFAMVLFFALPLSQPLWTMPALRRLIQFPYRFLSLGIFIGSWFIAYVLEDHKRIYVRTLLTCLFMGLALWYGVGAQKQIQYVEQPEGYYTTNEATTTVHDEYMPRWVIDKPIRRANERVVFYKGQGVFEPKRVNTQVIDAVIRASENSVLQINTVYYPGWGVTIDDQQVHVDYQNRQGVMHIAVPQGTHHIVAGFRETISRFLADNISLGFFVWYIVMLCIKKKSLV